MSNNLFTEEQYENALIDLFQNMGYQYECGYDVERNFRNPWYPEDLRDALLPCLMSGELKVEDITL